MATINSLNYELIIHNYSRLADKHKPAEIISQGGIQLERGDGDFIAAITSRGP